MSQKTVSTFARALQAVLEESGVHGITVGDVTPRNSSTTPSNTFEVSVSVGIAGARKGYMFLQTDFPTALALAQELSRALDVPLDDPDRFGSMHRAALAELANQVSGRATMYLSEIGVETSITPPSVLTGTGVTLAVADGLQFYDCAVTGPVGAFDLVVGLQES